MLNLFDHVTLIDIILAKVGAVSMPCQPSKGSVH